MSALQNSIAFFVNLGLYDVVMPFLLVFTIVYAMLEKTKVLGVDEQGTKKNLNAMMAFVVGFLVIASSQLVRIINTVLADVVLLLLLSVLFLMLAGSFHTSKEFSLENTGWAKFMMVVMFIGIVLIFLNALGWLHYLWWYLTGHIDGPVVGSFIMLAVVVFAMFWLVKDPKPAGAKKDK
jgi:hypothetical protein